MPGNPRRLELTPMSAKKTKSTSNILLKDLLAHVSNPDGFMSFLIANEARSGGGIDLDFYWTFIRLHQVFYNILNNHAMKPGRSDASDAPDAGNTGTDYPGALGWGLVGGGVAFTFIGMGRAIYQYLHDKYLKSDAYYIKQLSKLAPGQLDTPQAKANLESMIEKRVNDFANSGKTFDQASKERRHGAALFKDLDLSTPNLAEKLIDGLDDDLLSVLVTEDVNLAKSPRERAKLAKRVMHLIAVFKAYQVRQEIDSIKERMEERFKKGTATTVPQMITNFENKLLPRELKVGKLPLFVRAVNWISDTRVMSVVRTIYDWMQRYAYIYWLVLMPVIIIAGATFALASMGVVATTLAIGTALALWAGIKWVGQKFGWKLAGDGMLATIINSWFAPEKTPEEVAVIKEEQRQDHEAKLRHLVMSTHDVAMKAIYGDAVWIAKKKAFEDEKLVRKNAGSLTTSNRIGYSLVEKLKAVKANQALVESFTGSKHEQRFRLVVSVAGAISTFVGFTFLSFLVIAVLGVVIGPAFVAGGAATGAQWAVEAGNWVVGAAKFLSDAAAGATAGAMTTAVTAGGIGVGGSFFDYAKMRTAQTNTEIKVHAILSAEYKETGKSIMEVHGGLEQSIIDKINALEENAKKTRVPLSDKHLELIAAMKHSIQTQAQKGVRYFDKFETYASRWSNFKKIADGIYDFLNQAQTGIFCARNLFLASGAASVVIGGLAIATGGAALIVFVAAAAVLALVVGGLGVGKAMLDRRQKHRDETIEQMPAHIKTYKKWEQQLVAIDEHALKGVNGLKLSNADQPDKVVANQISLDKGLGLSRKHAGLGLDLVRNKNQVVPITNAGRVSKLNFLSGTPIVAAEDTSKRVARARSASFNSF